MGVSMRGSLMKNIGLCVGVVLFLLSSTVCFAQDPMTKLGRGVANSLTGWAELPKNVYDTSVQENAFVGATLGLARGVGMAIVRTGAGLLEVVSFPFPAPEDYKPILEPEYVF